MTSLSATASVVASASTASSSGTSALVKMANGEYTANSVSKDPTDAQKLGLVKEKDGNYGTTSPTIANTSSVAATASSGVQSALLSLTLGGQ